MKDKKTLRQEIRARRALLPEKYRIEAGQRIAELLLASELYRNSRTIFTYVSMAGEPDTRKILERAWADGKRVCVPKCLPDRQMAVVEVRDWSELPPGMLGIPEPADLSCQLSPEEPDLCIIPCVSAWSDGARLGHGGGYYDIFLQKSRGIRLCLCFEELLSPEIPMTEQDVPMELLLTEAGFVSCRT